VCSLNSSGRLRSTSRRRYRSKPLLLLATVIIQNACDQSPPAGRHQGDRQRLVVAVVGDGVGPSDYVPGQNPYPPNRAQGVDMQQGVDAAFMKSPLTERLRSLVELKYFIDAGAIGDAEKIALMLQADPRVVAVIGHATSGSTRRAAPYYAEAGIPLLMPIATSPWVRILGEPDAPTGRLKSCFRLPPADDRAQAPAVALFAKRHLKAEKCYVLRDRTKDTLDYAEPLSSAVRRLMKDGLSGPTEEAQRNSSLAELARSARHQGADLIIFCGYGTAANELLGELREAFKGQNPPIKIVLTDGCMIHDLDTTELEVYVTFPLPPLMHGAPSGADFGILANVVEKLDRYSYQLYGYDAVLMLAHACNELRTTDVSRDGLMQKLHSMAQFVGARSTYSFVEGDNVQSWYYVYRATKVASGSTQFVLHKELSPDEILRFSASPSPE